jgi:hypothetical protein
MGKWINKILEPTGATDSDHHIALEDMARLTEGTLDRAVRENLFHHINRCARCYEILQETLKDASFAATVHPSPVPWWKTKTALALAASIFLLFIIGGQLVFKQWSQDSGVILASFDLDQELKDILLENDVLRFGKGARLNRLVVVLQQKGLQVENLDFVELSQPYYQKKSLFGPREVLHVRIENNVAYLEVKEVD